MRGFSTQANYYSTAHKWHRSRKLSKSHQHAPQRKSSNFPFPLLGASLIEVSFSLICSEAFRRNSTTCAFHTRKHTIFLTKRLTLIRTRAKKQSRSTAFAIPCGLFDAVKPLHMHVKPPLGKAWRQCHYFPSPVAFRPPPKAAHRKVEKI